jgi:hypothetical protein
VETPADEDCLLFVEIAPARIAAFSHCAFLPSQQTSHHLFILVHWPKI